MKEKIGCRPSEAIALWDEALGGGAGKKSDHNLAFSEARFAGIPQLCFKEFHYGYWNGKRNKLVSNDVLAIYLKDEASSGGVSSASVGYESKEHASPDELKGFRHQLTIAENVPPYTIAHEIGHVLGLQHEMARSDRDNFVEFRCTKLKGFGIAILTAQSKPENKDLTIQDISTKLCTDGYFAGRNKFAAFNYIPIPDDGESAKDFDVDSIMMYGTSAFSTQDCGKATLEKCPLVKIKKENGVKVGVEEIRWPSGPSKGDVAFVKKYYPWKS